MSYPQAFHTSCRTGLSGISGFQINAASARLDERQLAALASKHARYVAPIDAPFEPTPEQMRAFPVALKMSVVPGLGPVVSRTEYVGREYRGANGTPDEGRFGNYFCHMIVGEDHADPFGGLAAVELWDAPHWTTQESPIAVLPELDELTPGPLDVATVLGVVSAAPDGVAAALVDRALAAMDGDLPLLILDPDPARAVTWLAWISYALPPDLARRLTFSTFEGRPADAAALHVVATTPACDQGATSGGRFERIDVTRPSVGSPTLYARVAAALAAEGPERLGMAIRRATGETTAERGAALAVAGGHTELIQDEDLPGLLMHVRGLAEAGHIDQAAAAVAELSTSDAADRAAITGWIALYAFARTRATGEAARDLASLALVRLIRCADALPEHLEQIPTSARTAPSVAGIGAWVRATEAARGTDRSGGYVLLGVRLGLAGLNVPVDARIAAVLADDLERRPTQRALDTIAAHGGLGHLITGVAEAVADGATRDPRARERLALLSRYEDAREAIGARADELGTFDAHVTWQRMRVAAGLATPAQAARALAPRAADAGARAEIRELWGPEGPRTAGDLDDLLHAYLDTGNPVPHEDEERAFRSLMRAPLPQARREGIGVTLSSLEAARSRADFWAWGAFVYDQPLYRWSAGAAVAFHDRDQQVPDERWNELVRYLGERLIAERRSPDFPATFERFSGTERPRLLGEMGVALAAETKRAKQRAEFAAAEFDFWVRRYSPDTFGPVLAAGFEPLSARDVDAVSELLIPQLLPHWHRWTEANPRGGKVARVLRRLTRERSELDA
jgi:hypothetical protein